MCIGKPIMAHVWRSEGNWQKLVLSSTMCVPGANSGLQALSQVSTWTLSHLSPWGNFSYLMLIFRELERFYGFEPYAIPCLALQVAALTVNLGSKVPLHPKLT